MRILGVRFKNLNSLAGEWQVDFTDPAYSSDGLFAITGPTGAGKTTILDAVCLGLYGRTPRLDKVTKSSNEVMSRQTGECFAEVTFETQKGRYRCHWSQHRARKRPGGELQQARHEIADAVSGEVLESRIVQVGEFIVAATGMDFARFTRSMLLAQGGFAAFLQAPPDERAPILEQITGTEIYSLISMKVHERRTEEREKLDLLQAELKGIPVLSAEQEGELQTGLTEKRSREAALERGVEGLRAAALWLERVAVLEKETVELDANLLQIEKRREAFAPESRKLEKARKALNLEGDYRAVAAQRTQQANEGQELAGDIGRLPEKEKVAAEALSRKLAAETSLNEARARQQTEGRVIRKVRDLDARLGEQKKHADDKEKAITDAERRQKEYQRGIEAIEAALKDAQADRGAVHDYLVKNAADSALATTVPVIAREFALIRDREASHVKAREALAAAAREKDAAAEAFGTIESDHERTRRELEEGQKALKALTDGIMAILKGRDIGEWRREADALKDRERLLVQTGETIERMDKNSAALDALRIRLESLRAAHAKLLGEITSLSDQRALLEKEAGNRETELLLLGRIRDLDQERKRLEDGKPCPLCGATDHPYAVGNVPELSRAETALKKTRAALKKVSERLGTLENERVKTATAIEHGGKEREEKEAARGADERQCADALVRLNITEPGTDFTSLPAPAGRVQEALAALRSGMAETAGIVAAVEETGKKEKAAQAVIEKLRVQFDTSGRALQDAGRRREAVGHEHERLIRDGETLAVEIQKARAAALRDVEPFGVGEIPDDLAAVLEDLTRRKDVWQVRQDAKIAVGKKIDEFKAGIDKDKALLESLEKDLAAWLREREALLKQYQSLDDSRRELFGEKDPDKEEKRLADAADEAGSTLDKTRGEYGRVEQEIGALKAKIASLKAKTRDRADLVAQAVEKLTERIGKAGFADEADYLASYLGEEERETLAAAENTLVREATELGARRKDRAAALAAERGKRLTERPIEALRAEMNAGEAELKRIRLDIGGIAKSLSDNETLRAKQRERTTEIDARKTECARWNALHELIGSADGKKFRNFAQGLTFEMMTMHANRRLAKMTDRYLLIRDPSQPLELNVIDNYQAGEIRSTKNLSGGESFIVSLALALGLSQMASRNVRIDSLFLDEGFGTLDEEALETALETLAGLRQDGKLIGVISHVAALKERIGTRIQVVPGAGGRSRITGPGCRGM
jgi:exonuclease SbcC